MWGQKITQFNATSISPKIFPITNTNPTQTQFTKLNIISYRFNPGLQFIKFTAPTKMTWLYCKKNNLSNSKTKMILFQNEFWPQISQRETILMINFVQKLEKKFKIKFLKEKVCIFVRSRHLFVCQSLHTMKTTYLYGCWVSFQFWFGVGETWGWGVGGSVDFLEFLGDKIYLSFLKNYKNFFFNFLKKIVYFFIFLSVWWWNFINISSTFTHSFTQLFCVLGGSISVGWCAFLFLSKDIKLINCFWKIRVALRRAGFGATCAG